MIRAAIPGLLFGCLLAAQPKLQVAQQALHQFEGGPAMQPPLSYLSTETLFFTCKVSGYQKTGKQTIALEWTVQAVDDSGVFLVAPKTGKVEEELAEEDKDWRPLIRHSFELPQTASCRACKLTVQVRDAVGKTMASGEIAFAIQGRVVEPSETLVIRNFRFLRGEEDANPLAVPAYRPGDEVWGRFEITGFRHGPRNRVNVEYGLSVYRPSGKLLYQEPKAAGADEASFYPKQYLPGILSLKLDSKMPPGEYPIVIEVRDLLGERKHAERVMFRIE